MTTLHTPKTLTVAGVLAAVRALCGPGERKAWIVDLFQVACPLDVDEDGFKSWLLERHLDGSLELSRYDLANQPELSSASEITYLNASWHRVVAA